VKNCNVIMYKSIFYVFSVFTHWYIVYIYIYLYLLLHSPYFYILLVFFLKVFFFLIKLCRTYYILAVVIFLQKQITVFLYCSFSTTFHFPPISPINNPPATHFSFQSCKFLSPTTSLLRPLPSQLSVMPSLKPYN